MPTMRETTKRKSAPPSASSPLLIQPQGRDLPAPFRRTILPPSEAATADYPGALDPAVTAALKAYGIDVLYRHQADALDLALAGDDVALATGTSSGKSLPSIAAALHLCRREPMARALFIYPTKALAQDQLRVVAPLAKGLGVSAAIYDGDTPPSRRASIRRTAGIVLTNPDMLHIGILPAHAVWGKFLRSLRLIVLDEMHVYGGVFGSHVAHVLRRLLRLCGLTHSRPQIIAASATVRDPGLMLELLTGRKAQVVNDDAAPRGERTLMMYERDPLHPNGGHRGLASDLFADLVRSGRRTLAFSRSRLETELLLRETRLKLEGQEDWIEGYRGGYTPKERRAIERRLFTGDLLGLATTNALELGIDVGGLDAVLLNGFPGRVSSFWQQIGRAGRGGREGLALFVARPDPLESHLLRHPYLLLDADIEPVHLNPENESILGDGLRCAAYENPLAPSELADFTPNALERAEALDRAGELSFRAGRFFLANPEPPAFGISLRTGDETFRLLLDGAELGTMERWRAMLNAHAGAIYLHRGETYRVLALDLANRAAHLEPTDEKIFTGSVVETAVDLCSPWAVEEMRTGAIALAPMKVTDTVLGYRVRSLTTYELLGTFPLDLPPREFDTAGLLVELPPPGPEDDPMLFAAGLHAAEHALLALAPLFAGCDPNDLGSAWTLDASGTGLPAVFVFDRQPGGVGLAEAIWSRREEWLRAAAALVADCGCDDGCPRCILAGRCPQGNEGLSKAGAEKILNNLV